MALLSEAGKASRRPLDVTSRVKERGPSLLLVRAKKGDEMTKREGEIDGSGGVSLPEANALKRQLKRRAGDWRVETADGRQKQGTRAGAGGWARNRVGKDGCGWC